MKRLFLLILLLAFAGCSSRTKDPVQAASDFFVSIGSGNTKEAYDSTAFAFQAGQTYLTFDAMVKDLGLTKALKINWSQQDRGEKEVKLKGEVLTASVKTVPVSVKLICERGEWRIFALSTPRQQDPTMETHFSLVGKGSAFNSVDNHELPNPATLQKLVEKSLAMFNAAIQERSFENFYKEVSVAWQQQLTPKRLQTAFQPFIDSQVNLGSLRGLTPVFDTPPQVNSDGLLILEGHYPTNPYQIYFALRFASEFPHWKLFGLDVQLRQ